MGGIPHVTLEGFCIDIFHTVVKCILEIFGGGIIDTVALAVVLEQLLLKVGLTFN